MLDREFAIDFSSMRRVVQAPLSRGASVPSSLQSDYGRAMNDLRQEIVAIVADGFQGKPLPARARTALASQATNPMFGPIVRPVVGAIDTLINQASDVPVSSTRAKQHFMAEILPYARQAGRALGVSENLVLAHAALESGWGKRPVTLKGGDPSFNLFGVKAGTSWGGPIADVTTTEYSDGLEVKGRQSFRAYSGYAEAFNDYVHLLRTARRYSPLIGAGEDVGRFSGALVNGAYATDPLYANKLKRLFSDVAAQRELRAPVSLPTAGRTQ